MKPKKTSANLAGKLGRFVQQYGRKAHKGHDPNDRSYDPKLEQKMKRMAPEELSELLYGEEIEPSSRPKQRKEE
jgi:hypothetical protein